MCFAGIEGEVSVFCASIARVRPNATSWTTGPWVRNTQVGAKDGLDHHKRADTHELVDSQHWIRSTDLLESQKAEGFEPITRPVEVRIARQLVDLASR